MSTAPDIGRLFVALPVPFAVATRLSGLQPQGPGVRLVAASDMHCTLHFLGSKTITGVRSALRSVAAASLNVKLNGLGCFSLRGGRRILWAGIEPTRELLDLHAVTAAALEVIGLPPESRAYRPHVTIARLSARAPKDIVDDFTHRAMSDIGAEFTCHEFALFESKTEPEGARYRVLETFPLGRA